VLKVIFGFIIVENYGWLEKEYGCENGKHFSAGTVQLGNYSDS